MDAIEQLAKLLEESKAEMVFRHCDVKAAFIDLREQFAEARRALESANRSLEVRTEDARLDQMEIREIGEECAELRRGLAASQTELSEAQRQLEAAKAWEEELKQQWRAHNVPERLDVLYGIAPVKPEFGGIIKPNPNRRWWQWWKPREITEFWYKKP